MKCVAYLMGIACVIVFGTTALPAEEDSQPTEVRAYYFGNSLTGNTMPPFHTEFGKSAGREWIIERSQGAGWQVWQHVYLDSVERHRRRLKTTRWDAIVVQPFGGRLFHEKVTEMWGGKHKFDRPTDVGDLHCTAELIELLLRGNPRGRALVYSAWPHMEVDVSKEQKKLSKDLKYAEEWHAIMESFRQSFDFEEKWLQDYDEERARNRVAWKRQGVSSRDHDYELLERLKARFPDMWRDGRLELIPAGDVFLALDRTMRAGEMPGLNGIGDYYTNGVHLRSGLPRYTVAATFYAILFRDRPHNLNWNIYNDRSAYMNKEQGTPGWWVCCQKDLGVHLEITPERAKAVNDTIWTVVADHRCTRIED